MVKTNVEYLKRRAKKIRKERSIRHHEALNEAAKEFGFQKYKHFLNQKQPTPTKAQEGDRE